MDVLDSRAFIGNLVPRVHVPNNVDNKGPLIFYAVGGWGGGGGRGGGGAGGI